MLLEFMPHGNFFHILNIGPLPLNIAKSLFSQLATTLHFLHSKGIVHGDIKPENILVSKDYRIKFCDFGFAKSLNADPSTRSIGGSIGYTAPEIYLT
jgi:serine/threonine protein kinase